MSAVCIERMDFVSQNLLSDKNQEGSEFLVWEPERGLTHGSFNSMDFPSVEAAEAAAEACLAKFTADPWVSPFARHRRLLFSHYGGAMVIARLVLSLYNGHRFPWDASSISNLDQKHFNIAVKLLASYHRYGENDRDFMSIGEDLAEQYLPDEGGLDASPN